MAINLGNLFINFEDAVVDATGNQTISYSGVTRTTSQYKYDSYSAQFTNIADSRIKVDDSVDFNIGTDDYTFDCWFRKDDTGWDANTLFNLGNYFNLNGILVLIRHYEDGTDDIRLLMPGASQSIEIAFVTTTNVWHHFAITRSSGAVKVFMNGQVIADEPTSLNGSIITEGDGLTIGTYGNETSNPFSGYIDNFRFVKGEALWTSAFDHTDDGALYYINTDFNPTRPDTIRGLYHKKTVNLRGQAKAGYVRPTIKEFFTSADWEAVLSDIPANDDFSAAELNLNRWDHTNSYINPVLDTERVGPHADGYGENVNSTFNEFKLDHKGILTGDFTCTVKVECAYASSAYRYGIYYVHAATESSQFSIRRDDDGLSGQIGGSTYFNNSMFNDTIWLRLRKVGNIAYVEYSTNGTSFTTLGTKDPGRTVVYEDGYLSLQGHTDQEFRLAGDQVWFDDVTFTTATFTNDFYV